MAGRARSADPSVAGAVAAHALSPIDLIPDFIPVVGYLDDLILVPIGIALAVRLIPPPLLSEFRAAAALRRDRPSSKVAIVIIVAAWGLGLTVATWWAWPHISRAVKWFARL
ncbi:hypothetical protein HMP09_p0037 (plasmid) [Sphingomonas sp. HMP9]|nr:hypothetical protein HMP09_p0037 [Sphingomonas sp. HMP9]